MQKTPEEELGVPPTVMTIEFFTPDGKRYNFEQSVIDTSMHVELTNQSGTTLLLRFWSTRQSDKNYPVDADAEKHYVEESLPSHPNNAAKTEKTKEQTSIYRYLWKRLFRTFPVIGRRRSA